MTADDLPHRLPTAPVAAPAGNATLGGGEVSETIVSLINEVRRDHHRAPMRLPSYGAFVAEKEEPFNTTLLPMDLQRVFGKLERDFSREYAA